MTDWHSVAMKDSKRAPWKVQRLALRLEMRLVGTTESRKVEWKAVPTAGLTVYHSADPTGYCSAEMKARSSECTQAGTMVDK